jgi:hypothetical protein
MRIAMGTEGDMPGRKTRSDLPIFVLYALIVFFFIKFVLKWIPDPIDESTLFAGFIGAISLFLGVILNWLKHDMDRLREDVAGIQSDLSTMRAEIATIKGKLWDTK